MKLISLCLATLVAGLVAGPVGAADGTLNFIGKVVNGACKLEGAGDNGVINVSMGDIPLSRLKNSQSGTGPAVGVDIRVKDCEKGTYYIVVDGPTPTGMPEHRVLALDGRGKPAGNVGICSPTVQALRSASMNASIRNTIPALRSRWTAAPAPSGSKLSTTPGIKPTWILATATRRPGLPLCRNSFPVRDETST